MARQAIFTHNDLDGLVSALIAQVALPAADVYFCDYAGLAGLVRARLHRYDTIWLTDLSLRDQTFFDDLRAADLDEVCWFDHHASSRPQDWMDECRIPTDGQSCAADVVRGYVEELGHTLPLPLQTLSDYAHDVDLWRRTLEAAQEFNDILGTMPVQDLYDELRADLQRVYDWTPAMRAAAGATRTARDRSRTLAEASTVWHALPSGEKLRACCCWGSVSEIGDELGDPDTLVILFDLRALERGQAKYSFRTQSRTIPADQIAERLGGGGHPMASGAPLEIEVLQELSRALAGRVAEVVQGLAKDAS